MTGLYLDIEEYAELTEEEAVDMALRYMMPPPKEEFNWYESESNTPIKDNRPNKKKKHSIHKCLGSSS